MFLSYQQVEATDVVKTATSLTVPAGATHVQLQADTQNVRYTMDDATNPTPFKGMSLVVGNSPETFLVEDLLRIKFCRGAAATGYLNIHYFGGRNI